MMTFRFTHALVLFVCLTLPYTSCASGHCSFAPSQTSDAPVIPDGFGVNIHFTDPLPGEIAMLAEAGFRWVRMDFKWDVTETQPGRYDFSEYERLLVALEQHQVHALFILDYGNPLYDNGAPPRTELTRQAFARWAVAAAKHFAGHGVLWEIYNEPNHATFWPPRPNPQEYVALALAVGRAFHEAVPDEKLIGPATSEIDFAFLESCFKAGLLKYWSAVSIHPYRRADPETAAQDYCRLREMIRTYAPSGEIQRPTSNVQGPIRTGGPPVPMGRLPRWGGSSDRVTAMPIISSEWGYSSAWPGVSEEKQGQILARSWLTNVANGISLSIWYDWRDDGSDTNNAEHHFGTVSPVFHERRDPVYDPKPAYLAAKTLTGFFKGYRFEKRLDLGGAEDYLLAFRKDGEVRFAAWTTASEAREVVLPLNAGRYATTRHTGQNGIVTSADQKGLRITLTAAPVYIR